MRRARDLVAAAGAADLPLVAKLERPQALDDLAGILAASDAVMVARGDLGLEMPLASVPRAQKEITRRARAQGVPVIVATQVLESMMHEARPTRAEVNDAANAVDDGVDAIMLAGETAAGDYPGRAVETLDAIIRDAEASPAFEVAPLYRRSTSESWRRSGRSSTPRGRRASTPGRPGPGCTGSTARRCSSKSGPRRRRARASSWDST